MLFLCPKKREAWRAYLCESTTKSQWSGTELQNVISLNCHTVTPKHSSNITAEQIIACGLQSIWWAHYAFAIDGKSFQRWPAARMRSGAQRTIAQNNQEQQF